MYGLDFDFLVIVDPEAPPGDVTEEDALLSSFSFSSPSPSPLIPTYPMLLLLCPRAELCLGLADDDATPPPRCRPVAGENVNADVDVRLGVGVGVEATLPPRRELVFLLGRMAGNCRPSSATEAALGVLRGKPMTLGAPFLVYLVEMR